jgi:hypothetical protein
MRILSLVAFVLASVLLVGCDALGIESGTTAAARKDADGKAIGSACRHAMRAIEDCYTLNPKAAKAAVYTGWRDMDEYMRENKIDGVAPVIPRKSAKPAEPASASDEAEPSERGAAAGAEHGTTADQTAPAAPRAKSHNKVAARQQTTH